MRDPHWFYCPMCVESFQHYDQWDKHRRALHGFGGVEALSPGGGQVVPTAFDLAQQLAEIRAELAVIRKMLEERL